MAPELTPTWSTWPGVTDKVVVIFEPRPPAPPETHAPGAALRRLSSPAVPGAPTASTFTWVTQGGTVNEPSSHANWWVKVREPSVPSTMWAAAVGADTA